jgi:hypothetical protein
MHGAPQKLYNPHDMNVERSNARIPKNHKYSLARTRPKHQRLVVDAVAVGVVEAVAVGIVGAVNDVDVTNGVDVTWF